MKKSLTVKNNTNVIKIRKFYFKYLLIYNISVALLTDSDINRMFNMVCNMMLKYRIVNREL
jgi:hypothetical protein